MVFLLDWISILFISLVRLISSMVIYYRQSYIEGEKNFFIFIILIILFVVSIILLIARPNIVRILLGWDGLGLVSYLLVIYYQNVKSYNAGILTVLSNRIGDVIILVSIGIIINLGGWNYYLFGEFIFSEIKFIGLIIILAGITKRAQIPFSSWLPAAIAAPTPVSSLVHSSTLVTAGVYLLIRFFPLFNNENLVLFLLLISCLTIFISGLGANFEFDLKKIIALSTLRQLGLIIGVLSLGLTNICFFHLIRHALFKALLFICAGFIIHNLRNYQDIRFIGRINKQVPLISVFFNASNLSLCGIPFLSGFYSKDLILEIIIIRNVNLFIYFLFIISTGFTILYSFRLFGFLILGSNNFSRLRIIEDKDFTIIKSIIFLFLGAIVGGRIIIWIIFPFNDLIIIPIWIKIRVLFLILSISYLGIINFLQTKFNLFIKNLKLKFFLGRIWFIPYLSTYYLRKILLNRRYNYIKIIELGIIEKLGGQGIREILLYLSRIMDFYKGFNYKIYLFIFTYIYLLVLFLWLTICLNSSN